LFKARELVQEVKFFVGFEFLENGVGARMGAGEDDAKFGSGKCNKSIVWRKFRGVVVKKDGDGFGKSGALGSSDSNGRVSGVGESASSVGG
jgi:hypothetical protein